MKKLKEKEQDKKHIVPEIIIGTVRIVFLLGLIPVIKNIKTTIVGTYQKVENKFIDSFLTKDDETVQDAKVRLTAKAQTIVETSRNTQKNNYQTAENLLLPFCKFSVNSNILIKF